MQTGLEGQSNNRFAGPLTSDHPSKHSSLGGSEAHVDPAHTLGSSPILDTSEYAEVAQTPSVSTNTVGTASVPVDSPGGSAQVAEGEKPKKGHRRGRSLTGLIPTLKTKPKRSQSQVMEVRCAVVCLLCYTLLWCAALCCAVLCCAVLRCAALCCAALRCAVLCCAVLSCAVLSCAVPQQLIC